MSSQKQMGAMSLQAKQPTATKQPFGVSPKAAVHGLVNNTFLLTQTAEASCQIVTSVSHEIKVALCSAYSKTTLSLPLHMHTAHGPLTSGEL